MTIDIEELKRLAEPLAAPNGADSNASWWDSFHRAANPAAVLELIAEVDRLRDEVNGMTGTLARLREQEPVRWYVRGNYFHDGDAAILFASMNAVHGAKVERLYAEPVPAPAVPYGVDEEAANRIALAVYDCKNGIKAEPLLHAINHILMKEIHPLSQEGLAQMQPIHQPVGNPDTLTPHKGATHCDGCGLTWLDDGLNPIGCPYCKQARALLQSAEVTK